MNQISKITAVIVITAIIVGGSVYMWLNNQENQPMTKESATSPTAELPTPTSGKETPETTTEVPPSSTISVEGLSFDLPKGWSLNKIVPRGTWHVAKINVPDPKYHVVLPVEISEDNRYTNSGGVDQLVKTTSSGAKIYSTACAPAIACYYLMYNNKTYMITFGMVESDEPAPENLDGPWFPSTTVTKQDTLNFVATVQ